MQLAASLPLLLLALSSTASARRPASIHERQLVPASQHSHGHLFTRQSTTSPGAKMAYPEAGDTAPGKDTLPQAWIDAYDKAKGAGLIPDIPASTENAAGTVDYPSGTDMTKACSWSVSKCDTGDIWLAPPGYAGISFDDGPTPQSPDLVKYLEQNAQGATHFLIGSSIYWNQDVMQTMASANPPLHFGVHTWSHTLQTTKSDYEVLGDLGWTMQIIYDFTGKVPMYFRPPEGDVDARVRAIAKEVLGLQTVMWNNDADDWCLRQGNGTATSIQSCVDGVGKSFDSVVAEEKSWADADKSKGFISLEHETTDQAINAFKQYHAELVSKGWKAAAIPDLQGLPWYQNQYGQNDSAVNVTSILPTRSAINVTDSSAAPGSSGAPDTSAWKNLASSTTTSNSTATGSGSTAKSSDTSSGTNSSSSSSNASAETNSTSGASASNNMLKSTASLSCALVAILGAALLF